MAISILEETFIPAVADASEVGKFLATERINGKVDIDLGRGEIVTAWAMKTDNGDIFVYGFVGRYRTSAKLWPAYLYVTTSGRTGERVLHGGFGRDDSCGKFQKLAGMFWSPENYFAA